MRKYILSFSATAIFFMLVACGGGAGKFNKVNQGEFLASIVETGELEAVNSRVMVMPHFDWSFGDPQVIFLEEEGKQVYIGDVVCQIDTSSIINVIGQNEAELEKMQAEIRQTQSENELELRKLDADLRAEQFNLEQAQINLERVEFESKQEQEKAELRLKKAQMTFKNLKQQLEYTKLIQTESMKIQELQKQKIVAEIQKAENTIDAFTFRAPSKGVVQHLKRHRRAREKVKVGDTPYPGTPLIGLPDISEMNVQTMVAETDVQKVHLGQQVNIRLDAFPKKIFDGNIIYVSKICRDKDRDSDQKIFDITVHINQSDRILRPGMTVSCEFIIEKLDDVLFVANDNISQDKDGTFVTRQSGKKVYVELGARNNEFSVVTGGLEKGDKLTRPEGEEE